MSLDVSDADFQVKVLERSAELPVVVDLWAPWCGPCRQLTPVLESLEKEYQGSFELVKINIDENPQVATELRAQSIPLVIGFRHGKAVSQFVGVKPPAAIREFLEQLIPSELELKLVAAGQALEQGDAKHAEKLIDEAAEISPDHDAVRFSRASVLMFKEDFSAAMDLLSTIPSNGHDEVANMLAKARLRSSATNDIRKLEQAAAKGDDLGAAVNYGRALAAQGEFEKALEILLSAVARDPGFDEGAARKAMLDLFEVMGTSHQLTREYRGKLSSALH